nr:immunoglobulin heavy chain junction region [Mus musculus]
CARFDYEGAMDYW